MDKVTSQWLSSITQYNTMVREPVTVTEYLCLTLGVPLHTARSELEMPYVIGIGLIEILEAGFSSEEKTVLWEIVRDMFTGLTPETQDTKIEECLIAFCEYTMFKTVPAPTGEDIITFKVVRIIKRYTLDKTVIDDAMRGVVKPSKYRSVRHRVYRAMRIIIKGAK